MCGIFGYLGKRTDANKILLHGLERLEYRGYDSAGIFVGNKKGDTKLIKSIGKVSKLGEKLNQDLSKDGDWSFGIAHTRWATHGGISEENTHPHHDMNENFHIVHNGIIENYHQLKKELETEGYKFYGQTDSEVVANLLDFMRTGDFLETVEKVLSKIRGAYALLIVSKRNPNEMIAVRLGSPLLFAYDKYNGFYFSSDKQALSGYVDKLIYMDDGDILHIKDGDYNIKANGIKIVRKVEDMDVDLLESSKGDYEHFMLKEVFEQPTIINRIFKGRVDFSNNTMNVDAFHGMKDENFKKIVFVGCGTSYNAGVLGTYYMENLAGLESISYIASEYEYQNIKVDDETLFVFVSQSGETADSIEVLKLLKSRGAHTFGIVNVAGSTISRLTDYGLFTRAGAEIGVASTKAFAAQITCILLLALFLGKKRGLSKAKYDKIMNELQKIPEKIENILSNSDKIKEIAEIISQYNDFFFLGRHYQLPIARESSLKFKEITYLHSEFYPTGELKHGPLALIDNKIPSVLFLPNDLLFEKNLSSVQEIKARDGIIVTLSDKDITGSDYHITIDSTIDELYPFITAVAGQLLAYHTAKKLGKEIDKPRNLAKSVTVK
ncbi:MAG TPA: glutamine--fructose-6-phosphate transaminase (isomerizing) [Candidatus Absconditabacterales bacterium]|nr:glutamine--fructose-6-phosphate transaminase (isomerizing) [Candidatus Absconditabacterales bacterium]